MKLIIIAGGKGTRLGNIEVPKAMTNIGGKPILEHQIELAKRYNLNDIIILVGYKSEQIINFFGDGSKWNVKISYSIEKKPLGTSGAIKLIEDLIKERFMVFYGDTIMDVNLRKLIEFDELNRSYGTLLVHPNDHPHDSDIIEIDENNNDIINFHSKPHNNDYKPNLVNAALYILSPKIFKYINSGEFSDFGKNIFPKIIYENKKLKAYSTAEYIKDMGTPKRLVKVENDYLNGKIRLLNNENKRSAIFIDRDGVINKEVDNLRKIEEFELIKNVPEAIKLINNSNYLALVITNQPVIAKGWSSFQNLKMIHNKMETLLGLKNAYLDKIYFCPHHPDSGYDGEIKELKKDCNCRKPKIGLITKAVDDFNIDLNSSYIIGDTTSDIKTGYNAGIKSIQVKTGYGGKDNKYDISPNFIADDLLSAVKQILKK